MRLYENRNDKREVQCNYCYAYGHNKRHCPTMKAHWDANPQVHETYDHSSLIGIDQTMFPTHYQTHWDEANAKRQFRCHWHYMKNRFAEKPKSTKPRKKPKCGFCGATTHNRRNCSKLKNFVYVLNETNKAFRSEYYDRYIEGKGLGAGALLSVRGAYGNPDRLAIMTSFPTEKIMFTMLKPSWSDYSSRFSSKVLIDGQKGYLSLTNDVFYTEEETDYTDVWRGMSTRWGQIKSVTSPAPNRPTKEWFLGQAPCFEWVVKKRSQQVLMNEFSGLIKHFYPHDNLRSKLGAKCYDRHYTR